MNTGDIVKFDYELWVVENDKKTLYETTMESIAKEQGIYDPNAKYRPMVAIIGKNMILHAFEESLKQAEIGKETELTLEPSKAYGPRNPNLVKVHSYREFEREKIEPEVGKFVTLNKRIGRVVRITPGRVIVDYNNVLAGKTLYYKYILRTIVTELKEQVVSIIDMRYGYDIENFEVSVNDEIEIILAESAKYKPEWITAKFNIISDIREKTDKPVKFVEIYKPPKPEKTKEETKEEKEIKN